MDFPVTDSGKITVGNHYLILMEGEASGKYSSLRGSPYKQ